MKRDKLETTPPPYWLVWSEDGFPPAYKHDDPGAAMVEAQRLARVNPGISFVVLEPIARITRQDTIIERFDGSDDGIPF